MQDMSLDTEKKLASQKTMTIPRQIELLDMSETTYQKVTSYALILVPFRYALIFTIL